MRVMDLRCRFGYHSWWTFSGIHPTYGRLYKKACSRCAAREYGQGLG